MNFNDTHACALQPYKACKLTVPP